MEKVQFHSSDKRFSSQLRNAEDTQPLLGSNPPDSKRDLNGTAQQQTSGAANCITEHEENTSHAFLIFSSLFVVMVNIALLSMSSTSGHIQGRKFLVMPNGDKMVPCPDKPESPVCFDVVDYEGQTVYRSEGDKRYLNLRKCSKFASNTNALECKGEFLFAHNSTIYWFQRLYYDSAESTYSLVAGATSNTGDIKGALRVRHMLNSPYNWILGHEEVPPNDFPDSALYVRGTIVSEHCLP